MFELVLSNGKLGIGESEKLSTLTVGGKAAFTLTGAVAKASASATLTGSSTLFLSEVGLGDRIAVPGGASETRSVIAIASDTSLTVDADFDNTASGETATCFPSVLRLEDGNDGPIVLVSDQGLVGLGTLAPALRTEANAGPLLRLESSIDDDRRLLMLANDGDNQGSFALHCFGGRLHFCPIVDNTRESEVLTLGPDEVYFGAGLRVPVRLIDANDTLTGFDLEVQVDAGVSGVTVALPEGQQGRVYSIVKIAGAGDVTVAPDGTDLVNGVKAPVTISTQWSGIRLTAIDDEQWVATAMPAL